MGKIKIEHDGGGVYQAGQVLGVDTLIRDYCDCTTDESLKDWLYRIPIPSAVAFIAAAWGIVYNFV